jgi:signal transduction histidine kinase
VLTNALAPRGLGQAAEDPDTRQAGAAPPRADADRLLALLLRATVVIPVIAFGLAGWLSYRAEFDDARDRLARTTDIVHEHAVKVLETHDLVAAQVEEILAGLSDAEIRQREPFLNTRLRALSDRLEQVQDIWVIDGAGRPLVTANLLPAPRDLDLSDRDYFREVRAGRPAAGSVYVSELLRGRVQDVRFFQLAQRRRTAAPDLSFPGVTAVSVDPAYFERYYAQVGATGFSSIALLRADGAVLARWPVAAPPGLRVDPDMELTNALAQASARGFAVGHLHSGTPERLLAYRRLPDRPIYVVVGLDTATVHYAWAGTMASHFAIGAPATAALLVLILFARRTLRRERAAQLVALESAERRADAEARLRHAQRVEALGQLVGGVAHDFNNVVQSVQAGTRIIRRRTPDPEVAKVLELMEGTAERGSRLIQRMLAFARRDDARTETTDVGASLKAVCELLDRTLGSGYRLDCDFTAADLPEVVGDSAEFETSIVNLSINARDAMPAGGTVRIEASLQKLMAGAEEAGDFVRVAVVDTGVGMDEATLQKAAEAFFTTKAPGKGTGLGLAQARAFAERAGGRLDIASAPGEGTTVTMWLPSVTASGRLERAA